MFIDARSVPEEQLVEADVCVVGAGAAGITMARELDGSGLTVCVLESGGLEPDAATQSLYKGENVGLDYWQLEASRLRFFGGTTNHWGGVCRPLNAIDFEQRDWVSHSGWPFDRDELLPFYRRAQPIPELGPFGYAGAQWETADATVLPFEKGPVITEVVQRSPPTRFGATYRETLEKSAKVSVYLNANVVDIEVNDAASEVMQLQVACLDGNRLRVRAKNYVLAMGGIENARLLLLSNKVQRSGLGNQHDLVGRFFADHAYLSNLGFMVLSDPGFDIGMYTKQHRVDGHRGSGYLTVSDGVRRQEKLLSTRVHVHQSNFKKFNKPRGDESLSEKIMRMYRDFTGADEVDPEANQILRFGAWIESVPDPDSRVSLGVDKDELGQRRVVLDWRMGVQEKDSLLRTLDIIGMELGRAGLGRMRIDIDQDSPWPWKGGGEPGLHHMGTTRMHDDPRSGVVDRHSKIHGLANLYVAGSSVFPTYGTPNPTFTILALTLRLADRLKETMK